ncbi:MAG: hypothetical protein HY701_11680 [Gemmatimonadetes bacterium]|nr:hypothetical protein [Gemmatimonadota bacterium]
MTSFFMLVPLAYSVLFSLAWLLGADLLDHRTDGDRVTFYSRTAAASLVGGVTGALVARFLASQVEPNVLLAAAAGSLILAVLVMALAQRRCQRRYSGGQARPPVVAQPLKSLSREPYFRVLLAVGALAALVGVLVEFQFYVAASGSSSTTRESTLFFANLYLLLSVLALFVQLLVTPRLQRWVGVGGALLVLPGALALLAPVAIMNASPALRSALRLTEGGLKSSVHRASWEQAFLPLSGHRRAAAKLLIDGAAARIAEGTAALVLYAWLTLMVGPRDLTSQDSAWITYALLASSLTWVLLTVRMARMRSSAGSSTATPSADAWLEVHSSDACPIVAALGDDVQTLEAA